MLINFSRLAVLLGAYIIPLSLMTIFYGKVLPDPQCYLLVSVSCLSAALVLAISQERCNGVFQILLKPIVVFIIVAVTVLLWIHIQRAYFTTSLVHETIIWLSQSIFALAMIWRTYIMVVYER